MYTRDRKDIFGGCTLIAIGTGVAINCALTLRMGSMAQMGPGLFPTALGVLLALLGAVVLIPALFRQGEPLVFDILPFATVLAAILAFGLTVRSFGMVPSIILLVAISSTADRKLHVSHALALGVVLAIGAALIFRVGLGLQLPLFAWKGW